MTSNRTYSDEVARLVDHAGLPQGYDESVATQIRNLIRENTGRKVPGTEPWLGVPISQLPLIFTPTLHAMLASGEVEIAERPAVTNPARMATFVRFTAKED